MSPTRRTVVILALVALGALWLPPAVVAVGMAVVAVAFVVDAYLIRRPPLIERTMPLEYARGAPAEFMVVVEPRPAVSVRVRQPQGADVRMDPSEGPDGLEGTVVVTHRGTHRVDPVVTASVGPLGLARWVHRHGEPTEVTCHADLPAARRIAAAVRDGSFDDPGLRRGPLGLGTDFESIREYTPDDDIRRMNWLATERTGRPMVNQYREDTEREVWCLIDTGRLLSAPVGDRTRLDAALDAVAAVAAVADVVGDRVGAVTFDDQVRQVIPPRRASAAGLVRLLDLLETRIVDSDYEAAFARVGSAKRSLVVVFTDILDAAASRPLLDAMPVLTRRHAVLVAGVADPDLVRVVTTDPETVPDLHRMAVATDLLAERDQVRGRLSAAGAVVLDARLDQLSTGCVSAYLRLKATARL